MNRLQICGLIIAVIFVGLSFYSGTLANPYYDRDYKVSVADSVDIQYTQYQYSELSSSSQNLFDQSKEVSTDLDADERYEEDVCREFVIVCDGYLSQNLPEEFLYDNTINQERIIVEKDDTKYYFSVRRSGYYPAMDSVLPSGEQIFFGFLNLLTFLTGVFIGSVVTNNLYSGGLKNRKQLSKITIGLIFVITIIGFIGFSLTVPSEILKNQIFPILIFIIILSTVSIILLYIPILLGIKAVKNDVQLREVVIGGFVITVFAVLTPYIVMTNIIDVNFARMIFLLLVSIYILEMTTGLFKTIFESSSNTDK